MNCIPPFLPPECVGRYKAAAAATAAAAAAVAAAWNRCASTLCDCAVVPQLVRGSPGVCVKISKSAAP